VLTVSVKKMTITGRSICSTNSDVTITGRSICSTNSDVIITGRSMCSASSYCDNNDNNGELYM
jgi:hypothetical protein